jgi:hypothetical protein
LYDQKFGTADVSAVSGKTSIPGQPATVNEVLKLEAAAPSTTED